MEATELPKTSCSHFHVPSKSKWSIVQGLPINELAREKLDITGKELLEEKEEAVKVCL